MHESNSMSAAGVDIIPFERAHLDSVVELAIRAWTPVFPGMANEIPPYVYRSFYPDGWEARQRTDVEAICIDGETRVWVATIADQVAGFVGLRVHAQDNMGEVHIIAVDPACQRRGVGRALLDFALHRFRQQGLAMAMVETGGDSGHAPSRAIYEGAGFERYPVARYFRKL
jgi:ribosomal protein S18 acetylase RimI-like enzyme